MSYVTLSEAKQHLRIDHNDEDSLITIYIEAAELNACQYLNLEELPQELAIKAAILLLVGDFYEHREAATEKELYRNHAVDSLLYPYRQEIGI